jgi:hypothetical protein
MYRGGKAFTKPLPFALGTNLQQATYWVNNGPNPTGIAFAQTIGMKFIRDQMAWNFALAGGGTPAINPSPGTYNNTSLGIYQSVVTTIKNAGMTPMFQVTIGGVDSGSNSGMCATLGVALVSGNVYTSINVNPNPDYAFGQQPGLPFAISIGDSIVLTDPTNQSHTQTVIATANMAAGATGNLSVVSFTANNNFPGGSSGGAWIYDSTVGRPCTPQHMATFMGWIVAQTGMQGIHWEIFNEPDGGSWPIPSSLVVQTYKLAYAAMKAADPTCTIHGLVLQNIDTGFTGTTFYNNCVALGILGYYDVLSIHMYTWSVAQTPDFVSGFNYPLWQLLAIFQANRLSLGDNTALGITECGFQYSGSGQTPQFQSQCLQNFLTTLSGIDPINNVAYSSYLRYFIHYWIANSTDPYTITPNNASSPAIGILQELVAGN